MRRIIAIVLFGAATATFGYMAAPHETIKVEKNLCGRGMACFDCVKVLGEKACNKIPD